MLNLELASVLGSFAGGPCTIFNLMLSPAVTKIVKQAFVSWHSINSLCKGALIGASARLRPCAVVLLRHPAASAVASRHNGSHAVAENADVVATAAFATDNVGSSPMRLQTSSTSPAPTVRVPPLRGAQRRGRVPNAQAPGELPGVVRDGAVRVHGGRDGNGAGGAPQRHLGGLGDSRNELAG